MLNWLVGGTDAHAKNFSMLIGAGGRARLAPLYDVASTLPYDFDPRKLKLATKIGEKFRIEEIDSRHLAKFATEIRLVPAEVLNMGKAMAEALPDALTEAVDEARALELDHPILQRMIDVLGARMQQCIRILEAAPV